MPRESGIRIRERRDRLFQIVHRFSRARLIVVGDVMLDHYIWGRVDRISPEAPVPVVTVGRESQHLGGAANVVHNIVALGGRADLFGVVGDDDFGPRVLMEMKRLGLGTEGVICDRTRPTTKKTRVIAHSQQLVRFDRERAEPVSKKMTQAMLHGIRRRIPGAQAVVVSDYAKGVITENLMPDLIGLAGEHGVPVIVDPKVVHMGMYKGARIITPNASEALGAAGISDRSDAGLQRAGRRILEGFGGQAVLVTRGEQGMSLFEKDGKITHIPASAREVYDVTGAGDTVIAALTLALASGAGVKEAAVIANSAAGIVVGIVGTATVDRDELIRSLGRGPSR